MELDLETKQRINSDLHNNNSDEAIMKSSQKMLKMTKHLSPVNVPAYENDCNFGGLNGLD